MNRLALMILKNIHIVPAGFAKLWHYAANVDKYPEQQTWDHIHYLMSRAIKAGNVDLVEMMGSAVHVHANACGEDTIIIVQTMDLDEQQKKDLMTIGSAVSFTFGGDVAHVFDRETGKNLEA